MGDRDYPTDKVQFRRLTDGSPMCICISCEVKDCPKTQHHEARDARWQAVIKAVEELWRTSLSSEDVRRFKAALKAMKRGSLEGMEKAVGIGVE